MQVIDLFSGIGGFSLAAEWINWRTIQFCEIDKFCQRVLSYYWPDVPIHDDIKTFTIKEFRKNELYNRNEKVILTGGFPCQPYSVAGKRKGKADDRHLWPEMLRTVREFKPDWVVAENVSGLITWNEGMVFNEVQTDLETAGYEVLSFLLPACGVNAPHRRYRIWIVAYSNRNSKSIKSVNENKRCRELGVITNSSSNGCQAGYSEAGGKKQESKQGRLQQFERGSSSSSFTFNEGLQRSKEVRNFGKEGKDENKQFARFICPDWQNFPTQSPLCSRDDGISDFIFSQTISKKHTMDRSELIIKCLSEGRIETNPETGQIFSRMIRGKEGQLTELRGSDCNGYVVHSIKYKGIHKQVKVHQVIWMSVYGSYDKSKLMIDHINRIKTDNRISNLRLVTSKGNTENMIRYKGQFTDEQKDIMVMLREYGMTNVEIAEDFGCSHSRVQQLITEHKIKRLSGITFPKWRNESIKAMGNAIVPQVALQIFKAIERYERILSKKENSQD